VEVILGFAFADDNLAPESLLRTQTWSLLTNSLPTPKLEQQDHDAPRSHRVAPALSAGKAHQGGAACSA
jgi:hypothetical protein